jgi:hypothetical protein
MLSPVHGTLRRVQAEFPLIQVVQFSRAGSKIYEPIELPFLETVQRVVTNLYRQPADPTEKDVDAALKVLVAQERATFFN